jgi:O-antigen/teichoic acid export membrane protein
LAYNIVMSFKMTEARILAVNISTRFSAYLVNIAISFFLTPFIRAALGTATYGFLGLGQNFISYLDIFTFLTAGTIFRYVMIEHTQDNPDRVNHYMASSFYGTLIYVGLMILPVIYFIARLASFLVIDPAIVQDVQWLFGLLLINFVLNTFFLIFRIGTQVVNKYYLIALRDLAAVFVEVSILLFLYTTFEPKLYYLGISMVVISAMTLIYDYAMMRHFLPEIRLKWVYVKWTYLKQLMSSGFYHMVKQLSTVLLVGLDLWFANVFVSDLAMGQLAIAKILPKTMQSFLNLATGSFNVMFTRLYAQKRIQHLVTQIKRGIKVLGTVTMLPNVILVVYGLPFFKLWIPGENAVLIYQLSVLTALVLVVSGLTQPLHNIFMMTDRLKFNAMVHLIYGIVSTLTVLIFLWTTDYGIYAIAGVSTIYGLMLPFIFHIPYAADCLGVPRSTFYPVIVKSMGVFGLMVGVGFGLSMIMMPSTWIGLIVACAVLGLVSVGILAFIYFSAEERQMFFNIFKRHA